MPWAVKRRLGVQIWRVISDYAKKTTTFGKDFFALGRLNGLNDFTARKFTFLARLKKLFLPLLVGGFVLVASVLGAAWWGQDHIIGLFVREANRYLRVPVRVGKIELSLLDQFPRVSITLHNVVVRGSLPTDTVALARARRLYFAFDAWDVLARRYRIRAVTLTDGQVAVRLDARGRPNYDVLQTDSATAGEPPLAFDLEGIQVARVSVVYADASRQQEFTLRTPELRAQLGVVGDLVTVRAQGQMHVRALRIGEDQYFRDKDLTITTQMRIDRAAQRLVLAPSKVGVGPASYGVAGTIDYAREATLDLRLDGRQTDVQSVVALLPPRLVRRFGAYRSRGDAYFRGTVRGPFSAAHTPRLEVAFGCRDAAFFQPEYQQEVAHVFLTGTFSNGAQRTATTSVLQLRDVRGTLAGRAFGGSLRYENFLDPTVQLRLQADVDVARALRFFPLAAVRSAGGDAHLTLACAGPVRQLRTGGSGAQATGELVLRNARAQLRAYSQPLAHLNGTFQLQRNDLLFSNLSGNLGRSDFRASGTLTNAVGWLLAPRQQLFIKADIASSLLDFDELLRLRGAAPTAAHAAGRAGGDYGLRLPASLGLEVRATARRVRFRRFRGRALAGTVRLRDQVISSPGLSVTALGGQASLRGTVDARQPTFLKASTVATCAGLPLDSLFYVFEDFGQRFITGRHLRGQLTARAESDVYFDRALYPITDRLEAEIQATVRNGELNNFEPLQKLALVASRRQLRHLRFAELTNNFYIQSRTVYMPEMDIRSNVRTASLIRVTGTHTFDQQMDYHLSIPLLPGLLHRPDAAGRTPTGPRLLLAVQGDEDNFSVRYDQDRAQAHRTAAAAAPATTGVPRRRGLLGGLIRPAAAATTPTPATAEAAPPRRPFELKKPAKKEPAQPQPGEYFNF